MISPETIFEPISPLFDWESKKTSVKSRMLSGSNVNRCSSIISMMNWRNFSKWSAVRDAAPCQNTMFYLIKISVMSHCRYLEGWFGKQAPWVPNDIWVGTVYNLGNAHRIYNIHTIYILQLVSISLTPNACYVSISHSVSYLQGMYLPSRDLSINHS